MRVLMIASWYPTPEAPVVGCFIRDQAQVLSREHQVAVVYPQMQNWRVLLKGGPETGALATVDEVSLSRPGGVLRPRGFSAASFYNAFYRGVKRSLFPVARVWGRPPEIVHAQVILPGGWAAARVAHDLGVPLVLTEHSGPFAFQVADESQRRRVDLVLERASAILPVGEQLHAEMLEYANEHGISIAAKTEVVGNVVRTDLFDLAPFSETDVPVFASVSLLSAVKDIGTTLRAARRLVDQGLTFRLVIGGEGPCRAELEALSHDLGLDNVCSFVGLLDRQGVRDLLRKCTAFVSSSVHESFGLVVAEALATGRPVVITRSGGPEGFVDAGNGLTVPVGDDEALAAAMMRMAIRHADYSPSRIRSGIDTLFGVDALLRRVGAVYRRVLS